jgi:hypothetical protein
LTDVVAGTDDAALERAIVECIALTSLLLTRSRQIAALEAAHVREALASAARTKQLTMWNWKLYEVYEHVARTGQFDMFAGASSTAVWHEMFNAVLGRERTAAIYDSVLLELDAREKTRKVSEHSSGTIRVPCQAMYCVMAPVTCAVLRLCALRNVTVLIHGSDNWKILVSLHHLGRLHLGPPSAVQRDAVQQCHAIDADVLSALLPRVLANADVGFDGGYGSLTIGGATIAAVCCPAPCKIVAWFGRNGQCVVANVICATVAVLCGWRLDSLAFLVSTRLPLDLLARLKLRLFIPAKILSLLKKGEIDAVRSNPAYLKTIDKQIVVADAVAGQPGRHAFEIEWSQRWLMVASVVYHNGNPADLAGVQSLFYVDNLIAAVQQSRRVGDDRTDVQRAHDEHQRQRFAAGEFTEAERAAQAHRGSRLAAGEFTEAERAAHARTATRLAAGEFTEAERGAHARTATRLAAGEFTEAERAAHARTATRLAAGEFTEAERGAHARTATRLAAGEFTEAERAAHARTATRLAAGEFTEAERAAHARTATRLAAGEFTEAERAHTTRLAAGEFTEAERAAHARTATRRAAGEFTETERAAHAHTATRLAAGEFTEAERAAHAHRGSRLAVSEFTEAERAAHARTATRRAAGEFTEAERAAHAFCATRRAAGQWTEAELAAHDQERNRPATDAERAACEARSNRFATGRLTVAERAMHDRFATGQTTEREHIARECARERFASGQFTAVEIAARELRAKRHAAGLLTAGELAMNARLQNGELSVAKRRRFATGQITARERGAVERARAEAAERAVNSELDAALAVKYYMQLATREAQAVGMPRDFVSATAAAFHRAVHEDVLGDEWTCACGVPLGATCHKVSTRREVRMTAPCNRCVTNGFIREKGRGCRWFVPREGFAGVLDMMWQARSLSN